MPGKPPSFVSTSLWQIPQASTLMRTCPTPGLGISRSTIWKSAPGLGICATFIGAVASFVAGIMPPKNSVASLTPLTQNDFQLDRGAERKACDSIHQAARALGFANDVLQQWPTQPRTFPSTCSVNRGGVQNLVCLVHRSSFFTIKPDVLQRDNWTKVLATLWYQPAYPVAFDDPRRHSAALQDGPRRR